jgi:hypothetical protein
MDRHTIDEMLDVLKPVLRSRSRAKKRLERYWSDKIAILWTTEDIHRAANERELALTEQEARGLLRDLFDHHNAQYGLKWEDITTLLEDRVLGRNLSKREIDRFVHRDIITINTRSRAR